MTGKISGVISTVEPGEAWEVTLKGLIDYLEGPEGLETDLESDDDQIVHLSVVQRVPVAEKPERIDKYLGDSPPRAYVQKKVQKNPVVVEEIVEYIAEDYDAHPDTYNMLLVLPRLSRVFGSSDLDNQDAFKRRVRAFISRIKSV
jgi:hypothetical protein